MGTSSNQLIDNLDYKETQEKADILMKLFRFFHQCCYYANPDSGRRQGAWTLIFTFVLFPFFHGCDYLPARFFFSDFYRYYSA